MITIYGLPAEQFTECLECGALFHNPSGKKSFCSSHCKYEALSGPRLKPKTCLWCEREFIPDRSKRKFCCNPCSNKYNGQVQVDQREPVYYAMKRYRKYPRWKRIKDKILKRDQYTCQVCFRNSNEVWLHVHHIKPLREFWPDRIRDSEASDNLITLCEHCHPKVESEQIQCPIPKTMEEAE